MSKVKTISILFFLLFVLNQTALTQVKWQDKVYDIDSLVNIALGYLRQDKLSESIELSRLALSAHPEYVDFKYILALNYKKMEKPDWATPYLLEIIDQSPNYKEAYSTLSTIYEAAGQLAKAKDIWQKALRQFPQEHDIQSSYLGFLEREEQYIRRHHTEDLLKQAKSAIDREDWQQALVYSDSLQRIAPNDFRRLYIESQAFMISKDYEKAKNNYLTLRQQGDTSSIIIEQLAQIAAFQKDYPLAMQYINDLKRQFPQSQKYANQYKIYVENLPYNFYVGMNHTHVFQDNPHGHFYISGLEYGRKIGSKTTLIGNFNYGNRRGESGYQAGVDAWLSYAPSLYAYHHIAWGSGNIFPSWRAAYNLYHETGPWIVDIGGRYSQSIDKQNNYGVTASGGRYFGPTIISLLAFVLNDEVRWNQAYALSVRYYYDEEKPHTYATIVGNIGTSPDDPARYQFLNTGSDLLSRSVNAGAQHRLGQWHIGLMGGWSYLKITQNRFMNQYDINISLKKYF